MKKKEFIIPTEAEKKEWKEYLYDTLWFLSTERYEFQPNKNDSLETLLESFLYWADEYNDGYFNEREEADNDRYCAWLVQEFYIYSSRYSWKEIEEIYDIPDDLVNRF